MLNVTSKSPGEVLLHAQSMFVTTTDTAGIITYCNDAFMATSGFPRDKLIGKPHSVVRHPDMPAEVFQDMWATLKQLHPWTGLLKNRTSDGRHFWVQASVLPILEGNELVAYRSVQTQPAREDVLPTEALYAMLRDTRSGGRRPVRIEGGAVVRTGLAGALDRCAHPTMKTQAHLVMFALAISGATVGALLTGGIEGLTWQRTLTALAACIALARLAEYRVRVMFVHPMRRLLSFVTRIAMGDLTQTLKNTWRPTGVVGKLEQTVNQVSLNTRAIVSDARAQMETMSQATATVNEGSHDLAARTESQAASLEQSAASMEQLTNSVQQTADTARQAAVNAGQASSVTQEGGLAIEAMSETMLVITEASRKIGEIINVIDEISFQTNVLALNAAVEAARAGEHGRGFAVVAGEVRNLASRVAVAAKEVATLIADSAEKVDAGSKIAESARDKIQQAVQAVREVSALIAEIDTAASEQSIGISQIKQALDHIEELTQQNTSLVSHLARSANTLASNADTVSGTMAMFRT